MTVNVRSFSPEDIAGIFGVIDAGNFEIANPQKSNLHPHDTDGTGDLILDDGTKASPFRPDTKALISGIISELESKMKDTHAAPHVRTAAGVRKFRQSLGAVIKRDLVPHVLDAPKPVPVDALPKPDSKAPETNKRLATHVRTRVKEARKKRNVNDEDVALKMEANASLHPDIMAKLQATEEGRAWLRKESVPNVRKILSNSGFGSTAMNRIPKMRQTLIDLDPSSSSRTEQENIDRADQLIAYIVGEDTFAENEFEGVDSYNDDASYGVALINHIWQGEKTSPGSSVYLTDGDKERIGRFRDHLDKIGSENPTVSKWTRKCIDTWASTAFDTNSLSIAMQATAETLYGGDSNVTRFPHVQEGGNTAQKKALADKVDKLITENAPFLAAFVSTVYERTQKSLAELDDNDTVRVFRGMQIDPSLIGSASTSNPTDEDYEEFVKTFWPDYLKTWMAETPLDEQVTRYHHAYDDDAPVRLAKQAFNDFMVQKHGHGIQMEDHASYTQGSVVFQPLSACATSRGSAVNFTSTWGSGTGDNAVPMLFTLDIPKERIWSIPTHGPGCLEEDELIVLGGEYTAGIERFGSNNDYLAVEDHLSDAGVSGKFLEAIDAEVGAQIKAGIPKGDTGWEKVNQEWFDKIGATAMHSQLGAMNGSWKWWDELVAKDKQYDVNLNWYYLLRSNGFSQSQAMAMAEAVNGKTSKQKVGRLSLAKHPAHKPGAKITAPTFTGESMVKGEGSGGGPAPGHFGHAHKKPFKKLIKKPAKKLPLKKISDVPTGFLANGKPKALAAYPYYHKQKFGSYKTYYGKPVPKVVKDAILAEGWTSNAKGTEFFPPDYDQQKYEYEHAIWAGATSAVTKKKVNAWMEKHPGFNYGEATLLYAKPGVTVTGGSTLHLGKSANWSPEWGKKMRVLGWGYPTYLGKDKGYVMKRAKKDMTPPKPPKPPKKKAVPPKPLKKIAKVAKKTAAVPGKFEGKTAASLASILNADHEYSKKMGSIPAPPTVLEKAFLIGYGYTLVDGLWKKKAAHKKLTPKAPTKKAAKKA